ncbi:MAG TPA: 3-carboxy-cis,cis-muconate cycloisomerase [Devosiaceae bacterium]|jgi:3-carboxy-cis,cis-muconate cycloisomerase|nr:3-carboxy-cis,cis-muconate cycloisomerase [Devosiaceae bacterium]
METGGAFGAGLGSPLLAGLLGDAELAAMLGADAEIAAILQFEVALARAAAAEGFVTDAAALALADACSGFRADHEALAAGVARDGVVMPALLAQLRQRLPAAHHSALHVGATSQDAIDTALILRLRSVLEIFEHRLHGLAARLDDLATRFGTRPLMARTRMQAALPTNVAHRINAWSRPVHDLRQNLNALLPQLLRLQLGGPVGTLDAFGPRGPAVRRRLAAALGLADAPQWHTDRGALADLAHWLSRLCGSLGKLGTDVALMAQNQPAEIALSGSGGSSSMPHKANPVRAEVLVALAKYAATLLPAMHHALLHEQERSGAAWTLEWLALPQLLQAAGSSLCSTRVLLGQVEWLGTSTDG